jgi:DNA polymerase-3 subunit epsilon
MIVDSFLRLFHQATIGDQAYRFLFKPGPPDEAVSIDCETTGLNPRKDDIVTVAAIMIRGNRILTSERFEATVRPEAAMKSDAMKVHHIRAMDVEAGGRLFSILPEFLRFIGGRPLVGYYIDFDVKMLNKHVLPFIQIMLPNRCIDVSRLYYELKYRKAPPGITIDLSFAAIRADLGLPDLGQHDAFQDALMTAMMYVILSDMKKRGERISWKRRLASATSEQAISRA